MMERLEAMSTEELLLALEESDVGRALREGEEFIAQMDIETLEKCGIIMKSDDWNGF